MKQTVIIWALAACTSFAMVACVARSTASVSRDVSSIYKSIHPSVNQSQFCKEEVDEQIGESCQGQDEKSCVTEMYSECMKGGV